MSGNGFHNIWLHFYEENSNVSFQKPPVTQKLFRKPPVILKIVLKAGHECALEKFNQ
jgi:hypothetical protein